MIDIMNLGRQDEPVRPAVAGQRRAAGDTAGSAGGRPAAMASDSCGLTDLAEMCAVTDGDRRALVLTGGWSGRWMTTWKVAGAKVTCPVADMGVFPVPGCEAANTGHSSRRLRAFCRCERRIGARACN
jgi:hypothetical protein